MEAVGGEMAAASTAATYNKEYIKTHETPKSIITRTILDATNILTATKRNS